MNNKSTLNLEGGVGLALWGKYKVQVFNPVINEVTYDSGWQKNLILNSGMDAISRVTYLSSCNLVGIIGIGSASWARPNIITGSTSEITQSGAMIYLNNATGLSTFSSSFATYSASVQIGDVIVDSDLSKSVVRVVTDDYNLIVDNSASYSTGKTFSIYKTSQQQLHNEASRSVTYLVGSSSIVGFNCGTALSASQLTLRRTYDFPAVANPAGKDFTEGGTSWSSTVRGPLFSRYVFPYVVNVPSGSQLRMVHDFVTRYSPSTPRYITASVTTWPVSPSVNVWATESIQRFSGSLPTKNMFSTINPDTRIGYGSALDPGALYISIISPTNHGCDTFVSEDTDVLSPFGSAITRDNNVGRQFAVDDGYVSGSYTRTKTSTISIYDAVSTVIRSIGFGQYFFSSPSNPVYGYDEERLAFCVRYDQPQTKTNAQQLRITWRFTWDRVLDR